MGECLLPRNRNQKNKTDDDNFDEKFIGAKHFDKGEMICVSFHMLSEDEIRCYLYIDQKYMRINLGPNGRLEQILKEYIQDTPSSSKEKAPVKDDGTNVLEFKTNDPAFDKYYRWVHSKV